MRKTSKSSALAAIHETASDLYDTRLMNKRTMKEFDALCLTPVTRLSADEIKAIREQLSISQNIFARYLNVSTGTVSKWERGEKRPSGASLKLLTIVKKKGLEAVA